MPSVVQDLTVVLVIGFLPAAPLWFYTWRAWTGRSRMWATRLGTDLHSFHRRNYLPLLLGAFGGSWAATWVLLFLKTQVPETASAASTALVIVWATLLVLVIWWPPVLAPRWHKEWLKRSGEKDWHPKRLWPPDEWREIEKHESAKRQAKARKRIQKRQENAGR